jgi:transposase-like protein/IS1 family transposase
MQSPTKGKAMTCHNCKIEAKKFGKDRKGNQRYRCAQCRKTFQQMKENPLGNMRVSLDKAEKCLQLMLEGMSIRSIQRITGLHQETILDLLVLAGQKAERIMNEKIKAIPVQDVEADEIWGFVKMKRNTRIRKGIEDLEVGDAFTYVGIERNTKLILAWHLGQRDTINTEAFTEKLNYATSGRFQITTDGLATYPDAISYSLGTRVDYAQLIKVYGKLDEEEERKYSPPKVVETITKYIIGHANPSRICTSIVERSNLSIRTSVRRLTRLTNAFSKKWENLYSMMSLYFCWYNFCRVHSTIRCTPAMESGITGHVWTLRELLQA